VDLNLHKHPAFGAINSDKQMAPSGLIGHLGQVFDIDLDEARLVAFEGFAGCIGSLGLSSMRLSTAVAAKTPVKTRARRLRKITSRVTANMS
jgi:hypothetical protein